MVTVCANAGPICAGVSNSKTAAVSAADKSDTKAEKFSVNLYQPMVLNGTTFKSGDAKVAIVGGKNRSPTKPCA